MEQIDRIIKFVKSLSERQQLLSKSVGGYDARIKTLENIAKENRRVIQNQNRAIRNQERIIRQLTNDFNNSKNEISDLKNTLKSLRS